MNVPVHFRVHADFKMSCKGAHNPMPSTRSRELNAHNWEVRYAPAPDNIYWSVPALCHFSNKEYIACNDILWLTLIYCRNLQL